MMMEESYSINQEVEVCFDDSHCIWFPATVVDRNLPPQNNTYSVKHWFRKETGEALLQTSTVSKDRIRPSPPTNNNRRRGYLMYDKVDAFYDFSWTCGFIAKEFGNKTFLVSFKGTDNPMVFSDNKLRTHMDWVDGRWIDEFQPRGADNGASKSRLSKKSEIANASEIINSTLREIEATETEAPKNQNSSMCQTDASSSKRRRVGSSSKTESRFLDDRVPKVATDDASSASEKSKTENAKIIITSTNCETDATKTKISNKQSSSQEPNTPTSIVCQTDTASKEPSSVSSLKPKTRSRDDKVTESKKVSGLENYTTLSLKRTGRPPKTPQASTKGNESKKGARTAEGTYDKECTTEHILALARDRMEIPQDDNCCQWRTKRSRTSMSDHKGQGKKTDELVIEKPKTRTPPVEAIKLPDDVLFLNSDSCFLDVKVTTGEKVRLLNNCTTESLERRGRPKRGDKSNEGAKSVEGTDKKVCEIKHVLPLAHNETEIPQDNNPCESHKEVSQAFLTDQQDQEHNSAGLDIEGAKGMQFSINEEVEVCFERDDTYAVWFPATVVKYLSESTYLVKYWVREESGKALLQNSTVTVKRIRPSPPMNKKRRGYSLHDKVDAFYDFSWNSGLIVEEFGDKTFMVSFKRTNNSMVFSETKLRTHIHWVDGKWIDEFQRKGDDNDAPQSRDFKKSEIENTSEILNSTLRETEATETKTPNKQNPSMCQTDAVSSKKRRNVSFPETESCSLDDKNPKVAKNNVSHSIPTKKSKTENAKAITTSTSGGSDATKTGTPQISSKEPKNQTSSVCETDAASAELRNFSSLKPKTRSRDDKASEGKKVSRLDNNTTLFLKRTGRPLRTSQSTTEVKDRKKGANTVEGTSDKECTTELIPTLARDETDIPQDNIRHQSCSRKSKTSMGDHKGQIADEPIIESEGKKVSRLDNNTTLFLKRTGRPLRTPQSTTEVKDRKKGANTVEGTSDKECTTELIPTLARDETDIPQDNIRHQSCSRKSKTSMGDHKGQIADEPIIEIKGEKVHILNNCTTSALIRKGRPRRGDKNNEGAKAVEGICKKVSEQVLPLAQNEQEKAVEGTGKKVCEQVLPLAQNETEIPHDNNPCESHKEGSQAFLSDQQGQEHNSAGLDTEVPNNTQKEQVDRSSDLLGTSSKKETPAKSIEKTTLAVSNDKPKNWPSKERGKTSVDPLAISQHSAIDDNNKSFLKTVGKTIMDSSAKSLQSAFDGVFQEESEDDTAAIDNGPEINTTDVDEILPFRKTVPLWDYIESMEIFKSRPQNPHFHSLESCDEDCREGLAIGLMVTFFKITQKIPGLRLNMSRSSMKTSLENLAELEDNGFDVKSIRDRLNDLLVKKDKHDILQNDLKEKEKQILESKNKKAKIDDTLDEINKNLNDLRAKREEVVLEKELKDAEIAMHQSSLDCNYNQIRIIQSDFENLATACW